MDFIENQGFPSCINATGHFSIVAFLPLPLPFVSSLKRMNTTDVGKFNQKIFYSTGIPVLRAILALALIYLYKGT